MLEAQFVFPGGLRSYEWITGGKAVLAHIVPRDEIVEIELADRALRFEAKLVGRRR